MSTETTPEGILISPLGQSPGSVSGLVFALQKLQEPIEITHVVTIGTNDYLVLQAATILGRLFKRMGITYDPIHIEHEEFTQEAVNDFGDKFGEAVRKNHEAGHSIHVSVTAGRAGMGGVAVMASAIYGADKLWYLCVPDDIANEGAADKIDLIEDVHEKNEFLNPTVDDIFYELVPLPQFELLRPIQALIKTAYEEEEYPDVQSPLYRLLSTGKYRRLEDIFPSDMRVKDIDKILGLARKGYQELIESEQMQITNELDELFKFYELSEEQEKVLKDFVESGPALPTAVMRSQVMFKLPKWSEIALNISLGVVSNYAFKYLTSP